ncbi:MAG: FAD-binding protein, partial [Dehalococcoidia bacterium]
HQGLEFFAECTINRLFKDGDRIAGALGYRRHTGELLLFKAKAVVLATGGAGRIWAITSNSWEGTGDGHALAMYAGADLIEMECIQFHPTGMVWPPSVKGILVTEGVRGDGGTLRNSTGERFMFNYIPPMFAAETAETIEEADRWYNDKTVRRTPDLLPRDEVARAINAEVKAGRGTPHGGVYLDIASRRDADYITSRLPSMYHQFKELAGVDITKESMEVGPTMHYIMGGVRVEPENAATNVPGLFAAGEVAGGMHGGNRLGGNSLSDLVVFGRRAGMGAAEYALGLTDQPALDTTEVETRTEVMLSPLSSDGRENPYAIHEDLREMMQVNVGIIRTESELLLALDEIAKLRDRWTRAKAPGGMTYNTGWHLALDLEHMLTVAEATTRAALERKESRGGHTREDYPDASPELGKVNVVVNLGEGGVEVRQDPLPEMPAELATLFAEGGSDGHS